MTNRWLTGGLLALASTFAGTANAQQQGNSYFFGYYYPEEHRFHSTMLNTNITDYTTITPMWNALHDPPGAVYPIVPTSEWLRGEVAPLVTPIPTQAAQVRVIVPEDAVVYFGRHRTHSTGTQRVYQTPALAQGTYVYHLTVAAKEGDRVISQERTVTVHPGQTAVVDFRQSFAAAH